MDVLLLGGALSLSVSLAPKILSQQQQQQRHKVSTADDASNTQQQQQPPIAATAAVTTRRNISPLTFSLGLSLSLFALSVLEATPSSWLVLLGNEVIKKSTTMDDGGSGDDGSDLNNESYDYLTVSNAYFLVLSTLSIYILVVFPSIVGVLIMERVIHRPTFYSWFCGSGGGGCGRYCSSRSESPWWLKLCKGLFKAVYKVIIMLLTVVYVMFQSCCGRTLQFFGKSRRKSAGGLSRRDSNKSQQSLPTTTKSIDTDPSTVLGCRLGCLATKIRELFVLKGGSFCLGSFLGVSGTYGILQFLAPFIIEPKSTGNSLALALSWVCAIGIVLSTLLNGFGSVSMPHACLAGLFLEPIRPESVTKAQDNLQKTQESLEARRRQLKDNVGLRPVTSSTNMSTINSNTATSTSSFWSIKRSTKRSFSGLGDQMKQRKRKIIEEIGFLESLVEEMKEDIDDMKFTQSVEASSRTTRGRVNSWMGVLFSFILLMRLYSAFISITHRWNKDSVATLDGQPPPRKNDLVTSLLLWLLGHHMVSERDYAQVSQGISLLLTALLSFSQVRAFLRTIGAIHRRMNHLFCVTPSSSRRSITPRNDSPSSGGIMEKSLALHPQTTLNQQQQQQQQQTGIYTHAIAALMGSYFIACLILAKTMVPWEYRSSFSGALGGFDAFAIQSDLITVFYSLSAVVSFTVLALLFGIQKQNSLRHNTSWTDDPSTTPKSLDV